MENYAKQNASKMYPHKMAGQLESYMVGKPKPMANIHSVFRCFGVFRSQGGGGDTPILYLHIGLRVAIGTRSANQNTEFRRICRGVPIEARPYEYSISFHGDLIRDTAHAQHQFRMWEEISAHNIEFGNKKRITIWNERAIQGLF